MMMVWVRSGDCVSYDTHNVNEAVDDVFGTAVVFRLGRGVVPKA